VVGAGADAGPGRAHGRKAPTRDGEPAGDLQCLTHRTRRPPPTHRCGAGHSLKASLSDAAKELAASQAAGCELLTWDEPEYPTRLREIYDPPPLLYVLGNIELLNKHLISIVGSRRPTPYGNQMAERLGRDLADRGIVVTSGMARGIDSCAHKGALSSASGATIGVLGSGIDVVYPEENKKIFADMQSRGAIITEFPMGTLPAPQNIPIRNRIIARIALGVVVAEGTQYSGSLITARLAMEFGREVFGVPGNATEPTSFGPNQLIKQGAKLVTSWEDVKSCPYPFERNSCWSNQHRPKNELLCSTKLSFRPTALCMSCERRSGPPHRRNHGGFRVYFD
jgi:DNA protecting protein DprA